MNTNTNTNMNTNPNTYKNTNINTNANTKTSREGWKGDHTYRQKYCTTQMAPWKNIVAPSQQGSGSMITHTVSVVSDVG